MQAGVAGMAVLLILVVLWDAFETIILPRRVTHSFRLARVFYRSMWLPWSAIARRMRDGGRRENFLSYFGPLSLILLLVVWAVSLVSGFAALYWALGAQMRTPDGSAGFLTDLYMSGVTFFTLGFGDVVPVLPLGRIIAVLEAGLGFGFLALVVGYLPALNQAFSRREVNVSMLDARAGSPSSAVEMLRRHGRDKDLAESRQFLNDWERWSADLLESHLSYPVLCYFRSQHEHQSWVAALTTILDTCALVITSIEGVPPRQAQLTFAMARHAAVDLSQIFNTPPLPPDPDRLPASDLARMRVLLDESGLSLQTDAEAERQFAELRGMYEPYVNALASRLLMPLPPWLPLQDAQDAWQTSAWERKGNHGR